MPNTRAQSIQNEIKKTLPEEQLRAKGSETLSPKLFCLPRPPCDRDLVIQKMLGHEWHWGYTIDKSIFVRILLHRDTTMAMGFNPPVSGVIRGWMYPVYYFAKVCPVFQFWQRHNKASEKRNNTNCTLLPLLHRSLYLLLYKCPLLGQVSSSQLETEMHSNIFKLFDFGPRTSILTG